MMIRGNYDAFVAAQNGISANVEKLAPEASDTDLTQQMVEEIVAQKGVEANAKSLQTADSMLQSLLDIKA